MLDEDTTVGAAELRSLLRLGATTPGGVPLTHSFNRRRPWGELRIKPDAMLLAPPVYWAAGGCDEDFVGSYGGTDVHFRYRAEALAGRGWLEMRRHEQIVLRELEPGHPCDGVPERSRARCLAAAAALPRASKDNIRNQALLLVKRSSGCWSNTFLRFNWSVAARFP